LRDTKNTKSTEGIRITGYDYSLKRLKIARDLEVACSAAVEGRSFDKLVEEAGAADIQREMMTGKQPVQIAGKPLESELENLAAEAGHHCAPVVHASAVLAHSFAFAEAVRQARQGIPVVLAVVVARAFAEDEDSAVATAAVAPAIAEVAEPMVVVLLWHPVV